MIIMKKKIAVIVSMIMAIGLVGCESASKKLIPIEKIPVEKVCFVTERGEIKDGSFNQQIWEGLEKIGKEKDISVDYIETKKTSEIKPAIEKMVSKGNRLIWGNGIETAKVVSELSPSNNQVYFGVIDVSLDGATKNAFGVVFRDQEAAFLAGYIAACTTKTNQVSFIGGEKNTTIEAFEWGFKGGVAYAGKKNGKTVQVHTEYIDTFSDIKKGKEVANKLYQAGSDIIYCAAGGASIGAIEAAKENDKWIIGVDRDQTMLAPKNVLVSTMKNVEIAVEELTLTMIQGGFLGGQNFEYGISNGSVDISENNGNVEKEVYENAKKIEEDIKAGYVIAPVNEDEYNAYNGNYQIES